MFEVVAPLASCPANRADCGRKRTNWDHDLAQLGQYQETLAAHLSGRGAADKGADMNSSAEKIDDIGIGSVTDELQPGTRLLGGQFTIDSFLNAGGFGITYLARDSLDRRVVVKECFPSSFCRRAGTAVAPRTRQREDDFRSVVKLFVQEALTLSRLQHHNIVKVHQVFEDNDTAYMAMEHIDGPDLLETIEGTAPALTPDQIMSILDQMLDAVDFVHAEGVLHRDISPDNILLDRRTGRPVLIDFGASRKDVTRKSRALSGLRVVKDGYSPQEFYISGSLQGPNSDLYALAATFCHLITRSTPKTSQERLSAIANRQGDPQPSVVGRAKGYAPEFLKAIDKGMSIFPRDRFQSVEEWRTLLRLGAKRPVLTSVPTPADAAMPVPVAAPAIPAATEPAVSVVVPGVANPVPAEALAMHAAVTPKAAAGRGPRDLLVSSAAAVLLLAGLLSLPGDLVQRFLPAALPTAPEAIAAAGSGLAAGQIELANGIVLQTIVTSDGSKPVVAALPAGALTDLKVGDVLLVYAATGEMLDSAAALDALLGREIANGVATFGFAVQRDGAMAVGSFQLPELDAAVLQQKDQNLENKT
jgi:serine/threonine protein kinase